MPTRPNALQREVDQLRRELTQLRKEVRSFRPPQFSFPRDVRLAVTVDTGNYPASGGSGNLVVPIKFVDGTFLQSPSWQTLQFTGRTDDPQVHAAHVAGGEYIAAGTLVVALWSRARTGIATAKTLGEWWIFPHMSTTTPVEIVRVKRGGFFAPGSSALFNVLSWSGSGWVDSGDDLFCADDSFSTCLLPNEEWEAIKFPGHSRHQLFPGGLRRWGVVNEAGGIDVGASGTVNMVDFIAGSCAGGELTSGSSVEVCNGDANTNGFRKVFDDEKVAIAYDRKSWHLTVPRMRIFGKLQSASSPLATGNSGTFDVYKAAPGFAAWGTNTVSARNNSGSNMTNAYEVEISWYGESTVPVAFFARADCA